jgi:6-pyruvoyltetrahydropterin/6-carboxytetrahydropterin synthase
MTAPHRIHVARERYKFSCAHMTVFPDGRKERLHGHNYYLAVEVELADVSFARMVEFEPLKEACAALCDRWKDHLLLARDNPHFELVRDEGGEIEFRLCGQRYLMPREDVLILPIDNVSVEALSAHAAELVVEKLREVTKTGVVSAISIRVEESPGQGATTRVIP